MLKVCKNEKCPQIVPPSRNTGVERIYCSYKCANAVAQRRYRGRRNGTLLDGSIRLVGEFPQLKRDIAATAATAETRFKTHLKRCHVSEGGPCIARFDPYDRKRECLIHAVLREDWDQLRRAEAGRVWDRIDTTQQGMWKESAAAIRARYVEAGQEIPDEIRAYL